METVKKTKSTGQPFRQFLSVQGGVLVFCCLFFGNPAVFRSYAGQQSSRTNVKTKIDSIENLLIKTNEDTVKMLLLLRLEQFYTSVNPEKAIACNQRVLSIAKKTGNKIRMAEGMNNIGAILTDLGNYPKALKYLRASISVYNNIGKKSSMAGPLGNIGMVYTYMGDYETGLKYILESQKIMEELKDTGELIISYVSTGAIYHYMGNYDLAIKNYEKSLAFALKLGDKLNCARAYNNIGLVYSKKPDYDKALEFYYKAIGIAGIPDVFLLINVYNNIGIALKNSGKTHEALSYYDKALTLAEEHSYLNTIAMELTNIAILYTDMGNYSKAIDNLNRAREILIKTGRSDYRYQVHRALADVYYKLNDSKNMYSNFQHYIGIKDSLLNDKTTKQIAEMQTRFETEKKEKEIVLLQKDKQLNTAELKRQRIITFSVIAGLLLVIASGLVLMNRFLVIRRQKAIITRQKQQVEMQKEIIEEKNRNITDSIEYASFIQGAIMPPPDELCKIAGESFIFHRQRDIIGGDFYFVTRVNGWNIVALVDCTGHGVPGALMSMLGKDMLNEIVNDRQITLAGSALDMLNIRVTDALNPDKKSEVKIKDGMDIAFIAFRDGELQFASARRPMIICSNGTLMRYNGDERSIGGERQTGKNYSTRHLKVQKGMMLYLFTDGFGDQMGGPKQSTGGGSAYGGKKFKTANLMNLFAEINLKQVQEQKQIVENTFIQWKGEYEQTDDVTVIGIKI